VAVIGKLPLKIGKPINDTRRQHITSTSTPTPCCNTRHDETSKQRLPRPVTLCQSPRQHRLPATIRDHLPLTMTLARVTCARLTVTRTTTVYHPVGPRAREVVVAPTLQGPPTALAGGAVGASRLLTPEKNGVPRPIADTSTSSLLAGMLTVIDRQLYCSSPDELSRRLPRYPLAPTYYL